ncbi:hypothetical protein QZH41_000124 [Actinostola sp. cb2023]|nr:hypothetical protein QZH41_000124 [Actinostola sp. cb2023]
MWDQESQKRRGKTGHLLGSFYMMFIDQEQWYQVQMAMLPIIAVLIGCFSVTLATNTCNGTVFICSKTPQTAARGGKCGLDDLRELKRLIVQPDRICSLNLSRNHLKSWHTIGLQDELPSLEYLDLSDNDGWTPDDMLLGSIGSLKEIKGVSWNKYCSDCTLKKVFNKTVLHEIEQKEKFEWVQGYACRAKITKYSNKVQLFAKFNFVAECFTEGSKCYNNDVIVKSKAPCRDVNIRVLALQYLFGPIAIILNLVVVLTTAFSERLRRNIAMVLVSNLAFGDFLNGIYSVIIAIVHHVYDYEETRAFADTKCNYIGPMWMIGQAIAVSCSLVLTYERYRSVVNSVKVKSRMKMKTARVAIMLCWAWSFLVAFLPFVGVGMYSIGTFCIPIYPVKSIPHQYWYSIVVTLSACLMYLALPLYVRLYLYVKKSSNRIGSTTDVTLAKRIFVLVISNMFFFLLPIAISLAWSILSRKQVMSRVLAEVLTSSFCAICLTVNSCLNPILYALRNKTFIKELKKMLYKRLRLCCGGTCGGPDNGYSIDKTSRSGSSVRASNYHVQKTTV